MSSDLLRAMLEVKKNLTVRAPLTKEQIEEWRYQFSITYGENEWNANISAQTIEENMRELNSICDMALKQIEA